MELLNGFFTNDCISRIIPPAAVTAIVSPPHGYGDMLGINLALSVAIHQEKHVVLFCPDEDTERLGCIMLGICSDVSIERLRAGILSGEEISRAMMTVSSLAALPILIDTTSYADMKTQLEALVTMINNECVEFIVMDWLLGPTQSWTMQPDNLLSLQRLATMLRVAIVVIVPPQSGDMALSTNTDEAVTTVTLMDSEQIAESQKRLINCELKETLGSPVSFTLQFNEETYRMSRPEKDGEKNQ